MTPKWNFGEVNYSWNSGKSGVGKSNSEEGVSFGKEKKNKKK